MELKDFFCPVCGKDFTEDDDVVFCPECGTPHHRSCWKENGKCINENLHGTDNDIRVTYTIAESEKNKAPEHEKIPLDVTAAENSDAPVMHRNIEINGNTSINGKPAYLYEIAIGKNQKYYIPRFLVEDKGIKTPSWNFISFLFPLAWTLYRKMYRFSLIIFAIYVALISVTGYFVLSNEDYVNTSKACLEEDPEFLTKILMYESDEEVTLTPKQKDFLKALDNVYIPGYVTNGSAIILYAVRFLIGIFGNRLYFKKLSKSIDKGISKGLTGDGLKMFAYKKNGVLPIAFAVIVGIAEWFLV